MFKKWLFIGLLVLSFRCTSSRWIVEDEHAIDLSTAETLNKKVIFNFDGVEKVGNNTFLTFSIKEVKSIRYKQKIQSRRYIQNYQPRWFWMISGLGLSASVFYYGNFVDYGNSSNSQLNRILFNVLGSSIFIGNFYVQKPVGSPLKTDEIQLQSETGTIIKNDTVTAVHLSDKKAFLNVYYKNQLWVNDQAVSIQNGKLTLNLFNYLNSQPISVKDEDKMIVDIEFETNFQEFFIPLKQVLYPYISFKSNGAIYSKPEGNRTNQITQTERKSLYPFVSEFNENWFVIQFGPATAYAPKEETQIVWAQKGLDSKQFVEKLLIGNGASDALNIEWDIPFESRRPHRPKAILINNLKTGDSSTQDNLRVLKAYLIQTFGYESDEVMLYNQISMEDLKSIKSMMESNQFLSEVTIYFTGYWNFDSQPQLSFYNKNNQTDWVNYSDVLNGFENLKSATYRIFFDVSAPDHTIQSFKQSQQIEKSSNKFLSGLDQSFIWFSSKAHQKAASYEYVNGAQKYHYSTFIYYAMLGLKQGMYQLSDLKLFVDRELIFYSRKKSGISQESMLFGNAQLNLLQ